MLSLVLKHKTYIPQNYVNPSIQHSIFFDNLVSLVLKEEVIPIIGAIVDSKYILGWLHIVNKNGALLTDIKSALIGNGNTISRKR